MKKIVYWITYVVSEMEKEFVAEIWNREKKCVYRTVFRTDSIEEKCLDVQFYFAVSNPKQFLVKIYQQKLTETEKHRIHEMFPYIPKFTNLKEFTFWYKYCNSSFSYLKYEAIQQCVEDIQTLEQLKSDGTWNCVEIQNETYLYCKWTDEAGKNHTVVIDDQIFVSDLNYDEICDQEVLFETGKVLDFTSFLDTHRHAMLDVYVKNGGRKIFSFLTAPKINHPMELLGKAGLTKLADNVEKLEGINVEGKNFTSIFRVPLMVLRSLEKGSYDMLCTFEEREILAKAFSENRAIFTDPMTEMGEMWLHYYYMRNQTIFDGGENEKMPRNLAETIRYLNKMCENGNNIYNIFGLYQNYIAHAENIGKFVDGVYPKNLEEAVQKEIDILRQRYDATHLSTFQAIVRSPEYKYYEDDSVLYPYRIQAPQDASDLVDAGKKLHNCLGNYAKRIKYGIRKVYFLYDKNNDELIGAIEIEDGGVEQALGACNRKLPEDVWRYLKDYMERKQLEDHTVYRRWW